MATSKVAQLEELVLSLVARICTLEKTLDATVEAQILNTPDCVEKLNYLEDIVDSKFDHVFERLDNLACQMQMNEPGGEFSSPVVLKLEDCVNKSSEIALPALPTLPPFPRIEEDVSRYEYNCAMMKLSDMESQLVEGKLVTQSAAQHWVEHACSKVMAPLDLSEIRKSIDCEEIAMRAVLQVANEKFPGEALPVISKTQRKTTKKVKFCSKLESR